MISKHTHPHHAFLLSRRHQNKSLPNHFFLQHITATHHNHQITLNLRHTSFKMSIFNNNNNPQNCLSEQQYPSNQERALHAAATEEEDVPPMTNQEPIVAFQFLHVDGEPMPCTIAWRATYAFLGATGVAHHYGQDTLVKVLGVLSLVFWAVALRLEKMHRYKFGMRGLGWVRRA